MQECVFCGIVDGTLPSFKFFENSEFMAILDKYPNTAGQSLVIPKKHLDSYLFDLSPEYISELMKFTRDTARILEKGLKVLRVHLVIEGMLINHLHAKLYPLHGITEKFQKIETVERVFFTRYPGYLTTLLGPEAGDSELENMRKRIIFSSGKGNIRQMSD